MGRPRKRRRKGEGEGDEITITPSELIDNPLDVNNFSSFPDLGVMTPPRFQDLNFPMEGPNHENEIPTHHDFAIPEARNVSPPSAIEYEFLLHIKSTLIIISFSPEFPIDPSLWDNITVTAPPQNDPAYFTIAPCTCLSLIYLTLTELQSIPTFAFPQVIVPLRKGMNALSDLINCPQCPKDNFSAIQNISSITALFKAIVERFKQVFTAIDVETERLEQTGEKKSYRIGDASPELMHLHTGTADCPMGFNIEIEPKDFKRLAKTALKTELYGRGSNPRPLLQLLADAEERQKRWHQDKGYHCAERQHMLGDRRPDDVNGTCEALAAGHIRREINNLRWD